MHATSSVSFVFPGCTSKDECRVSYRVDDQLVYNTSSAAVLQSWKRSDANTPGRTGAEAGDPCAAFDDDCEANGVCLQGPGWILLEDRLRYPGQ